MTQSNNLKQQQAQRMLELFAIASVAVFESRESPKMYQMTAWVSATARSIKCPPVGS